MAEYDEAPLDRLVTLPPGLPELTLGWEMVQWAGKLLRHPNGPRAGRRWEFVKSQVLFLLWWYALDENGQWLFHHGVRRLAKGSGKSPFAGLHALGEFCAPVRLDDFDPKAPGGARGKPVAMPWVQIAATSESQTANTMRMVRALAPKGSRIVREYKLDVGKTVFYKPDGGQLEVITSSAAAAEGAEVTFAVGDETEHWTPARGGPELAEVLDRNLAKSGSRMIETCNAWTPGEGSVAETTFEAWVAQEEGRTRGSSRILYDARVAPSDVNLADEASLTKALDHVYDDCWWVPRDVIRERVWDPRTPPDVSRRFYLNQPTASSDSWITQPEWAACRVADGHVSRLAGDELVDVPVSPVQRGDMITLGFDGSRKRAQGVTDATALIGCRVSDGHVFEIEVWEQPLGPQGDDWQVPTELVDATVRDAFRTYTVVGFYADPAKWESFVAKWEADYGGRLKVKSSRDHPIEWWMTGGRSGLIVRALEQFHTAVVEREMTHDGASRLSTHMLNARRRKTRSGIQIMKEHPDSARKIDAAVAAVLAWQARLDAVAAGYGVKRTNRVPQRIR